MSLERERRTIRAMIGIYCRAHHPVSTDLCEECQALFEYAEARLGKCPFGSDKPVCANCEIHCYRPDMRSRVRDVMRFSGPRMALHHPALAVAHLLQKRKQTPERRQQARALELEAATPEQKCHECDKAKRF